MEKQRALFKQVINHPLVKKNKLAILGVLVLAVIIFTVWFLLILEVPLPFAKGDISGVVYRTDSIQTANKVKVVLDGNQETKTDNKGQFFFYDIPVGKHSLSFSSTLYQSQNTDAIVSTRETKPLDITMAIKSFKSDEIILTSGNEYGGEIWLLDSSGQPLVLLGEGSKPRFTADGSAVQYEKSSELFEVSLDGSDLKRKSKIKTTTTSQANNQTSDDGKYTVVTERYNNIYVKDIATDQKVASLPNSSSYPGWIPHTHKVMVNYFDSSTLTSHIVVIDVDNGGKNTEVFSYGSDSKVVILPRYAVWASDQKYFMTSDYIVDVDNKKIAELPKHHQGVFLPGDLLLLTFYETAETAKGTYLFKPDAEKVKVIKKISDELFTQTIDISTDGKKTLLSDGKSLYIFETDSSEVKRITPPDQVFSSGQWLKK